jgi:serine/threonine protein phosphatase 1
VDKRNQKNHFDFQNDLVISTEGLVDRVTENLEYISLLDESWFFTVRGNHEEMCIRSPQS